MLPEATARPDAAQTVIARRPGAAAIQGTLEQRLHSRLLDCFASLAITKRLVIASAIAASGFAAGAQADGLDLGTIKDSLPNLTTAGVTIYGTIDIGYSYGTSNAPFNGAWYGGVADNLLSSKAGREGLGNFVESGLEQSRIGLKIEEPLDYNWVAIGKLETGFNPLSGELADACGSLARNNGVPLYMQSENLDGARCGQAFNGPAYGGISNSDYGTLTIGRQQNLQFDAAAAYDPMNLSYAFSLLGWSGGTEGGGVTETARWDDSAKYVYQYGPLHAAAMYSTGGDSTALFGDAWGVNVGGAWRGFSLDAVYQRESSAVSASSLPWTACGPFAAAAAPAFCPTNTLNATISDNEQWSVQAKYTFQFENGGMKDEEPAGKLTLYGGYSAIAYEDPSTPIFSGSTIGGYVLTNFNNTAYYTDKNLNLAWAGATYALGSNWIFSAAWYHEDYGNYLTGSAGTSCTAETASNEAATATTYTAQNGSTQHKFYGNTIGSNCAGTFNQGSFLVDYVFSKHFDVYAGVSYQDLTGGMDSGYLSSDNTFFATGMRLKF